MASKRLISYSLWGSDACYNDGAVANVELAAHIYPGWTCRFYASPESPAYERLKSMDCEVIPMTPLGWLGLFWRFMAASDAEAEVVLFRDTDSYLSEREAAVVAEWMDSGKALHTMHDCHEHISVPILGGMWGLRCGEVPDMSSLVKQWLDGRVPDNLGPDQEFLKEVIWPRFRDNHLGHVDEPSLPLVRELAGVESYRPFPPLASGTLAVGASFKPAVRADGSRASATPSNQTESPVSAEGTHKHTTSTLTVAGSRRGDIWYVFPSCNPERALRACLAWKEQGYVTAVLLEYGLSDVGGDFELFESPYQGYYRSANRLCQMAVARGAQFVVVGGDDMYPDPHKSAAEIAAEFQERFPDGYGVMQPIGDDLDGTDRICGSPWLGREFVRASYGGLGPFWPEYGHFFGDQELFCVSQGQDVLWQRSDLTHRHEHWMREGADAQTDYQIRNGNAHWKHDEELFHARLRAKFPGHERRSAVSTMPAIATVAV